MDGVPDQLAPTVVSASHDAVVLRIRPVFEPLDLRVAAVFLLPFLLFTVAVALSSSDLLAFGVAVTIGVGGVLGYAASGPRCAELALGSHSIRCTVERSFGSTRFEVPLADLVSVAVGGEAIHLSTRSGQHHTVPIPHRTQATYEALDAWLVRVEARAVALGQPGDVPDAVQRLREQEPER